MNTRKALVTLALTVFGSAASLGVSAGASNPENDSGSFFATSSTSAATASATRFGLARVGDISSDGLYVYSGTDRGWINRTHSYVLVAGHFEHSPNCLAYNTPKPASGTAPSGAKLGEHGA